MVMDARSGEVLHAQNADTPLHPASLTKMMTLYVTFEAIENGEISADTLVSVSRAAADQPPSKLGLRAGQRIALRHLIRASAVRSANDAAHALAEAIEGSVPAFAARMNRTALALGMTRTHFKNPHGLTQGGHVSTARDMTLLGRALFHHYPAYYHLFSREVIDAGGRTVRNTNRALLGAYAGADGIKTGYTRAAGFNLVASAERGNKRVIATVFGGRSSTWRNQRVAELLDLGFEKSRGRVALAMPPRPPYSGSQRAVAIAAAHVVASPVVARSPRPRARPEVPTAMAAAPDTIEAVVIAEAVAAATTPPPATAPATSVAAAPPPRARPEGLLPEQRVAGADTGDELTGTEVTVETAEAAPVEVADAEPIEPAYAEPRIVTRKSAANGKLWAVSLGTQPSQYHADTLLLQTALREVGTLAEAPRKVNRRAGGFEAEFVGLSEIDALRACARLAAGGVACSVTGP
ncbi:MAG: D-alanyl-D-alanine carboxypeptidase [Alphaproteobacteria bacterium HGW-Alphaproteobacteria-2]|nr:MAG: D-alanyl-D-alanine carboxypeptidase [Alphaproteobacteria bacterium HGW-Alphaproteobacteria-2]